MSQGSIAASSPLFRAYRLGNLHYSAAIGTPIAAHDVRRTYAKLAHKGSGRLDQIQLTLGHASIRTTEKYLGITQDLQDAPCDHLGLRLDWTEAGPR